MSRTSHWKYLPLNEKWSHWAIYGDDELLDVIPDIHAVRAERFIEKNREIFHRIRIFRARLVSENEFEIQRKRGHVLPGLKA